MKKALLILCLLVLITGVWYTTEANSMTSVPSMAFCQMAQTLDNIGMTNERACVCSKVLHGVQLKEVPPCDAGGVSKER